MIAEEDLGAAVAEGIIDQAQAVRIVHLARMRRAAGGMPAVPVAAIDPDDERFRLIGGFNDVFVAIGVGLLAGALVGLTRILGFGDAFSVVAALSAWGLSEIFARRMRLALPSILLAAMFAGAVAAATGLLAESRLGGVAFLPPLVLAAAGFTVAAALHHLRFRVPVDAALATLGGLGVVLSLIGIRAPAVLDDYFAPILFASGLAVFVLALVLDMGDPERRTRRSDQAFWLHLLAAGLIVHPVFRTLIGGIGEIGSGEAALILALFAVLALVALVIDRRALLVSGLSYAGVAIAYLITRNVTADLALPLALLGLAILVLALSAGWRRLRRVLMPRLPLGSLRERLPPVEAPLA